MVTACKVGVLCGVCYVLAGCNAAAEEPEPVAGYNREAVSYTASPAVEAIVVKVPELSLADAKEKPVAVELPKAVNVGDAIVLEGAIDVGDPKAVGGIVHVAFLKKGKDGTDVITNTGQVTVSDADSKDGILRYRVQILVPQNKGKQSVELKVLHPYSSPDFQVFGRSGTTDVI